jgi:hypothetical protein
MPQLYVILPVGGGEHPDQGLPPGHAHPGNRPPGSWGGPVDPGWGGGGHPHPGNRPPGSWEGHPDQGLPGGPPDHPWWGGGGGGGRPDQGLPPGAEPRGEEVPPDVYTPAPIPEQIASQYVVSVYNPKTMQWTTKSYPPR